LNVFHNSVIQVFVEVITFLNLLIFSSQVAVKLLNFDLAKVTDFVNLFTDFCAASNQTLVVSPLNKANCFLASINCF